jgi:hypothetical protein
MRAALRLGRLEAAQIDFLAQVAPGGGDNLTGTQRDLVSARLVGPGARVWLFATRAEAHSDRWQSSSPAAPLMPLARRARKPEGDQNPCPIRCGFDGRINPGLREASIWAARERHRGSADLALTLASGWWAGRAD